MNRYERVLLYTLAIATVALAMLAAENVRWENRQVKFNQQVMRAWGVDLPEEGEQVNGP